MKNTFTSEGLELVKFFEGCRLEAYTDSTGIPTIGYGATHYFNGDAVKIGDKIDQEDANNMLFRQIETEGSHFIDVWCSKTILNDAQYSALSSFIYNCGCGTFKKSPVFTELLDNKLNAAADSFLAYNKAGGVVQKGLSLRRNAERAMFLGYDWRVFAK